MAIPHSSMNSDNPFESDVFNQNLFGYMDGNGVEDNKE